MTYSKTTGAINHGIRFKFMVLREGECKFFERTDVVARLKYVYRMDVLERRLSYDEVTEIFVRVNSLGAKLRSSDLALAQITAKWRNSLKTFEAFQQQCAKTGFELDLGLYLKNLVVFTTGQSRFLTVGNLLLEALQVGWKESCRGWSSRSTS